MSGALTPQFLFDLETNMRVISDQAYQGLLAKLWYNRVTHDMPSSTRKERLIWLLDTARIDYVNRLGDEVMFDEIVSHTTEFESKAATGGLILNRFQMEDTDGNGVQLAAHWARGIGSYAAYWPQKQVAAAIRNGAVSGNNSYDGVTFFNASHPLNPFDSSLGTYGNIITSVDISTTVTLDVALTNLGTAIATVQNIKSTNGEDPRGLKVEGIVVPSKMVPRAQQLTNARFMAQAASSGGGSADVEAVIRNWGLGDPIEAPELGAAYGGSDSVYYLLCSQAGVGAELASPLIYVNREPFSVIYHGIVDSAELARMNQLQWITRGRNVVTYGHPFLLFKCSA